MAWRLGWFAAARGIRSAPGSWSCIVVALALPFGYYTASPLMDPDRAGRARPGRRGPVVRRDRGARDPRRPPLSSVRRSRPRRPPRPRSWRARSPPDPFAGTDDFHFGKGTASIIETAPGAYHLRLDDFSVRNGPDLFVYLSPEADDYAKGALEVGKLKATDGAFGYDLPAGTDPADFASAIIWCKQFSHLFAVAPFGAV